MYYESEKDLFPKPEDNFTMLLNGSRLSGKTHLIVNKLLPQIYREKFDMVYILGPNAHLYNQFVLRIGEKIGRYTPELLRSVVKKQKDILAQKGWIHGVDDVSKRPDFRTLIVLDDCMGSQGFKKNAGSDILNEIAITGRHLNLSLIVTVQKLTGVSSIFRENTECLINFNFRGDQDLLIKEFAFTDKKRMINLIRDGTQSRFGFICIRLRDKNNIWHYDSERKEYVITQI